MKQVESQQSEYEKNKKLFHAKHSIKFCKFILSDVFDFDEELKRKLNLLFGNFQILKPAQRYKIVKVFEQQRKDMSVDVNNCLETKQVVRIMSPESQQILDNHLKQLVEIEFYQCKIFDTLPNNSMILFYEVLENGLTY